MRRLVCIFLIICFAGGMISPAWAAKKYKVSAKGVLFSNSTKAKRYYGKKVHQRIVPASTIKVMTALIVLETLPLDKVVTISHRPALVQPSMIYLKEGEQYYVRDLLYALLLKSANDAAVALAEAVSGSEAAFARKMNARAKRLGAKKTYFVNAHGLPSDKEQYSTPYDMYLIFRQAIKNNFFKNAIEHRYKKIRSLAGREITLRSHNKILFKGWKRPVYGKTGWTRKARQCFLGYVKIGNDICIISLFGATKRWQDIRHIISRYGGIVLK